MPALLKRTNLLLALASAALIFSDAAMADIEKWVDRDGQVHYGDQPPPEAGATPLKVRPNVIETGRDVSPTISAAPPANANSDAEAGSNPVLERRPDIQAYVEQCLANRGVDCEREAQAMIDGPATVLFPGDPAILPRPDLKPPPPGLPLKLEIKP